MVSWVGNSSQPSLPHVWHVKLPVKGVLNTPAWYASYAMLMSSCPWLLIDREKWLYARVLCWPHRAGVSVCHLAFIVVLISGLCNNYQEGGGVLK